MCIEYGRDVTGDNFSACGMRCECPRGCSGRDLAGYFGDWS